MSQRKSYITILNNFKKGKIHLSRHKVLTYLAAIKLNMIVSDYYGNVDLVSLDHTRVAKINFRDNVSRIVMPYTTLPKVHKYILVCEFDIGNNSNYEIIKLNYDEELSNVPLSTRNIRKLFLDYVLS